MDRLDRVRLFCEIAERASFAKAARALRVSPSAATRAVAALEDELGVSLFRRTTRSVNLTPEGAAYLEQARHALAVLDNAARSLRGGDAEPRGSLVVTAPIVFGRMHILPIVLRLLRDHPRLNVRLTLNDRVVRLAEEGIDVAVRIAELSDSALRAVKVADVRRVLVASPAYLAARGAPKAAAQLKQHDLIAVENFTQNGEWRFAGPGRPAVRVVPRLFTDSVEAAIAAAIDGLGVARVLSYQVARHIRERRLAPVLGVLAPPPVPVNLVFQANRQHAPNVRALLSAARGYFAGRPDL